MHSERHYSSVSRSSSLRRPTSVTGSGSPSFGDLVGEFSRLNTMVMDRMNQAVMDVLEPVISTAERERKPKVKRFSDDCCDSCQRDDCECRCCIGDADLVVYARPGEVRIIPLRVENSRRRERQVKLEFSGWSSRGGQQTNIPTLITPEGELTLPPCGEGEFRLRVDLGSSFQPSPDTGAARGFTLDDCAVLYGDLRAVGCEIRPIRVALALLPLDCDVYVIDCGCTCC